MQNQIGKDFCQVQQRIFDHRPFLSSEINSFLQNFELRRNDKEVEQLFQTTEAVGELKYDLTPRCNSLATTYLNNFSQEINELLNGVQEFLQAQQPRPISEKLKESRLTREERKQQFLLDLQHKFERIDNSFEQKEEEISDLYTDLQLKLNIKS